MHVLTIVKRLRPRDFYVVTNAENLIKRTVVASLWQTAVYGHLSHPLTDLIWKTANYSKMANYS